MRCLIDTNILISASLFPESLPAQAYIKAVTSPHKGIICDISLDELKRVYNRKFPHKTAVLEHFIVQFLFSAEIVVTPPPEDAYEEEKLIRDANDRPILRAAIRSKADVLITGDKDFLEANIRSIQIITAAQFMRLK